jgi:hypothetical protein
MGAELTAKAMEPIIGQRHWDHDAAGKALAGAIRGHFAQTVSRAAKAGENQTLGNRRVG